MDSQSQIELMAEHLWARRSHRAGWFAANRVKDASDRGDASMKDLWTRIHAVLDTPNDPPAI